MTHMDKEKDIMVEWQKWWDERAGSVESLPELVGAGSYQFDPKTVQFLHGMLYQYLQKTRSSKTCLDAGCGVGLYFPLLESIFEKIIGLDFSHETLRRTPLA